MFHKFVGVFFLLGGIFFLGMNFLDYFEILPMYKTDVYIGSYTSRSIALVLFTFMGICYLWGAYAALARKPTK